jgi:hypothetical protein
MNIGQAIEALKEEKKVSREGWNSKGMFLKLYTPSQDEGFVLEVDGEGRWLQLAPHILMKTVDSQLVPWLPSQTDILAEDWDVVE